MQGNATPSARSVERQCRQCGAAFLTKLYFIKRGGGIYCGRPCQAAASMKRIMLICPGCGKAFERSPSQVAATNYCSKPCRTLARGPVIVNCAACGKPSLIERTRAEVGQGKFCSSRCYGASMAGVVTDPEIRFWAQVDKSETCWLWKGGTDRKGYGRFDQGAAHRFAWRLVSLTEITPTRPIGHVCDTPACVRNDDIGVYVVGGIEYERHGHLWLATPAANSLDMIEKGRTSTGERHWTKRRK